MDTPHATLIAQSVSDWNRLRRTKEILRPELAGADLSGLDLIGADLRLANLRNANIVNSDLTVANLTAADLRRADFSGSDLVGADFTMAGLSGASFRKATLTRATFHESTFAGTDLTEATIGSTTFAEVDLRDALGLETIRHTGPSTIGVDTLLLVGGHGQDDFLRKAGVPQVMIEYLPSLTSSAIEFYSCFISYSQRDKHFADRLYDALQGYGVRCWLDSHQLRPGDNIYDSVDQGIKAWDKVLLCCSEHSLSSWWVDNEISLALSKERQLLNERSQRVSILIPLNLDNYLFSPEWSSGKRQQVLDRLAADFTDWENDHKKFKRAFENLIKALHVGGTGLDRRPKPKI